MRNEGQVSVTFVGGKTEPETTDEVLVDEVENIIVSSS
jgi:hypothetical protein